MSSPPPRLWECYRSARLAIVARFPDGTAADGTRVCDLRVKDDAVVAVDPAGAVRGLEAEPRSGAALLASAWSRGVV